jgi:hypothetical protein
MEGRGSARDEQMLLFVIYTIGFCTNADSSMKK